MPYCQPPIEHRLTPETAARYRHTQKHPNGYLTCTLKRILLKKYRCQDPETHKIKKIMGAKGLMQVLTWEGMQGNIPAIKEILERIDGKVEQKLLGEGFTNPEAKVIIIYANKPAEVNSNTESRIPAA